MPPELEWFANIVYAYPRRVYRNDMTGVSRVWLRQYHEVAELSSQAGTVEIWSFVVQYQF